MCVVVTVWVDATVDQPLCLHPTTPKVYIHMSTATFDGSEGPAAEPPDWWGGPGAAVVELQLRLLVVASIVQRGGWRDLRLSVSGTER